MREGFLICRQSGLLVGCVGRRLSRLLRDAFGVWRRLCDFNAALYTADSGFLTYTLYVYYNRREAAKNGAGCPIAKITIHLLWREVFGFDGLWGWVQESV